MKKLEEKIESFLEKVEDKYCELKDFCEPLASFVLGFVGTLLTLLTITLALVLVSFLTKVFGVVVGFVIGLCFVMGFIFASADF